MFGMNTVVLTLFSFGITCVLSVNLPSYIQICHRSDPEVEKCILNSIESLRPRLKNGLPELDVPAIEPLVLPVVKVSDESGFTAYGKNIKILGPSNFQITKLKADLSNENRPRFNIGVTLPHLELDGEYEIDARVLVLPINGKGNIWTNITNAKADIVLYGQLHKKGNHNYIRFNKIDMGLKLHDYTISLSNLFGGDKILEEATNRALNENKKEFMQSVNPTVIKTISEITLDIANKISKNQPYDVLFPL